MIENSKFIRFLKNYEPAKTTEDENEKLYVPKSLRTLSPTSILALKRLVLYRPRRDLFPLKRRAAVMVGLFASRHGHLNVLLTKRSLTMRTYAGQTALPGGKMEGSDKSLEETARREAYEECGITLNPKKVRFLNRLEPFLTRGNLIVTPIIFFISDQTLVPRLNKDEVDVLFSHQLESVLHQPKSNKTRPEEEGEGEGGLKNSTHQSNHHDQHESNFSFVAHFSWPSTIEYPYKFFEFPTKRSPLVGFTADVLIEVARIGYDQEPNYERKVSKDQVSREELIRLSIENSIDFKEDESARKVEKHDILEDLSGNPSRTNLKIDIRLINLFGFFKRRNKFFWNNLSSRGGIFGRAKL